MNTRFLFRTSLIAFGIALLLAGLFFQGGFASHAAQAVVPTNTPSALERLAPPTMPANPSQADLGAKDYWLYCLPCHGDFGQGLTDEFRETYPPAEVDCWQSGCHGKRPYENGFTLPTAIPAVIADDAISNFTDAAQLHSYIRVAMPYWDPNSLTDEEYWRITAFLMRENGLWDGVGELKDSNAGEVSIPRGAPTMPPTQEQAQVKNGAGDGTLFLFGFGIFIMIVVAIILFRNVKTSSRE